MFPEDRIPTSNNKKMYFQDMLHFHVLHRRIPISKISISFRIIRDQCHLSTMTILSTGRIMIFVTKVSMIYPMEFSLAFPMGRNRMDFLTDYTKKGVTAQSLTTITHIIPFVANKNKLKPRSTDNTKTHSARTVLISNKSIKWTVIIVRTSACRKLSVISMIQVNGGLSCCALIG